MDDSFLAGWWSKLQIEIFDLAGNKLLTANVECRI